MPAWLGLLSPWSRWAPQGPIDTGRLLPGTAGPRPVAALQTYFSSLGQAHTAAGGASKTPWFTERFKSCPCEGVLHKNIEHRRGKITFMKCCCFSSSPARAKARPAQEDRGKGRQTSKVPQPRVPVLCARSCQVPKRCPQDSSTPGAVLLVTGLSHLHNLPVGQTKLAPSYRALTRLWAENEASKTKALQLFKPKRTCPF